MSRIARLVGAAAVVASALAVVPAQADQQQLLCWYDRQIHTSDGTIHYRVLDVCR